MKCILLGFKKNNRFLLNNNIIYSNSNVNRSIVSPFSMYNYSNIIINSIYSKEYHTTCYNLGRHVGSRALEPQPRAFSKKQMKRKARRILFKTQRIDIKKQKLKERFFKDQVKSGDAREMVEREKEKLGDVVKALMLPDFNNDINDLLSDVDNIIELPEHINAKYVLGKLREMNDKSSSTSSSSSNALSTESRITSISIIDDNNTNNMVEIDYEKCNQFLMELLDNNNTRKQGIEMSNIMKALNIPFTHKYHQYKINGYIYRKQYTDAIDYFKSVLSDDMISITSRLYNSFLHALMTANDIDKEQAKKLALKTLNESPHAPLVIAQILDDFAEQMEVKIIKSKNNKFFGNKVEAIFNELMSLDLVPDSRHWAALIRSKAIIGTEKAGDDALELLERLKKLNVPTTPSMYSAILEAYVDGNAFEKSKKFWLSMHHVGLEVLTKEAFDIMLKRCSKTKEVERAFFYMDEMRSLKVSPNVETFVQLFRACAEAPHWVDGYQDTIFDAMSRMEGAELLPNTKIYNTIIYAFGRAGDSIAAEYYFWEMRRKGIPQTRVTYNTFLNAIGTEQLVYAKKYNLGIKGRFSKPPDEELSDDEKDIVTVGATRVAKLYAQGIDQDIVDRGSRQKGVLTDPSDDDEDYQEAIMDQIRQEAREIRKSLPSSPSSSSWPKLEDSFESKSRTNRLEQRNTIPTLSKLDNNNSNGDDDDLNELESDPEVQALLKEMGITSLQSLLDNNSDSNADSDEIVQEGKDVSMEHFDPQALNELFADFEKRINSRNNDSNKKKSNKMDEESIRELMNEMNTASSSSSSSSSSSLHGGRKKDKRILKRPKKLNNNDNNNDNDEDDEVFVNKLFKGSNYNSYLSKKKMISDEETIYKRNENSEEYDNPFSEEQFRPPMSLRSYDSIRSEKESTKSEVIDLLDGVSNNNDDKIKLPSTSSSSSSSSSTSSLMKQLLSNISSDDIDSQWKIIEFGRAPEPNYTEERSSRVQSNINKAEKVFNDMKKNGMKPDAATLTSLMKVYADADRVESAINIFENYFPEYRIPHDAKAYRVLVRMFIRVNDIDEALALTKKMEEKGLMNDSETYGLLIESLTHRQMLVEALNFLEEASDKNVHVPNRHIRLLRTRCEKLGIVHPNMPDDPHQWIKDVKKMRYDNKNNSKRNIEPIRSALYS